MHKEISEQLLKFIEKSPTAFHAVRTIAEELSAAGFSELKENERWTVKKGGRYYVIRNGSSIIAFSVPSLDMSGMRIMASHSDSPAFKIKENAELDTEQQYVRLNVEGYGGMLCAPWFDRPLSAAGRIVVKDPQTGQFRSVLVNIDKDLVLIPSLAIHMNREANSGYKYNIQKDLLPLYGNFTAKGTFMNLITANASQRLGISLTADDVLGHDLYLYNRQKGSIWGASGEFISSPRLDDLQCAFASTQGFLSALKEPAQGSPSPLPVLCILDNEEVGSSTKQGAASTFLYDTLTRLHDALNMSREDYLIRLADSLMISADNAHAVHPNHTDKADPSNRPYLNGGIVIKYNANQKYCTDAVSSAMFRDICRNAQVPVQTFANRSDMAGGSTLGNISNTRVALNTVDIGLPQLAMHSPYETAGVKDTLYLIKASEAFFNFGGSIAS